jgi:hypothetical protein
MNSSANLETEVVRTASREGLALHQRYGRMPSLDRLVEAVLATGEPWLAQIAGDRRERVTAILQTYLSRNKCITTLGKRRRKRRWRA